MKDRRRNPTPSRIYQPPELDLATTPRGLASERGSDGRGERREPKFYILMVPLGPRLVLSTSWRPLAALMFMCSAADLLSTSAFGFSTRSDMADASPRSLAPPGDLAGDGGGGEVWRRKRKGARRRGSGAGAVGFGASAGWGLGVGRDSGEVETALDGGGIPRAATGRALSCAREASNKWALAHGAHQPLIVLIFPFPPTKEMYSLAKL